jgi:hypothetical protein
MLTALGVIVLREDARRSTSIQSSVIRITIWFFVIFSFVFLMNSLISDTENAAMGSILIMTGLPLYFSGNTSKSKSNQ